MWYLWLVVGIIAGSVITNLIYIVKSGFGVFRIDRSNPEKDIFRLELKDVDGISKKKYLFIKVDNNADLSQK